MDRSDRLRQLLINYEFQLRHGRAPLTVGPMNLYAIRLTVQTFGGEMPDHVREAKEDALRRSVWWAKSAEDGRRKLKERAEERASEKYRWWIE